MDYKFGLIIGIENESYPFSSSFVSNTKQYQKETINSLNFS